MIHPIKSVIARQQTWVINNFARTKYAKKLRRFKNIHTGETCVIVGNGPSLKSEDLTIIHEKGIPTFGFNRIYLMFDQTDWRPTYYMSQDEKLLGNCKKQVDEMKIKYKFIPVFHKYFHNINIKNAYHFHLKPPKTEYPLFSKDISEYFGGSTTVAYSAAQLAVYMGFKRIILIGVDHSFSTYKNDKGEIISDETVKDYFSDEYFKDKAQLYIPNLDASTRAFMAMREYCDKNDVEVYNSTRGGRLEVFTRVDLESIFDNI